jgi:hypothetical protein
MRYNDLKELLIRGVCLSFSIYVVKSPECLKNMYLSHVQLIVWVHLREQSMTDFEN